MTGEHLSATCFQRRVKADWSTMPDMGRHRRKFGRNRKPPKSGSHRRIQPKSVDFGPQSGRDRPNSAEITGTYPESPQHQPKSPQVVGVAEIGAKFGAKFGRWTEMCSGQKLRRRVPAEISQGKMCRRRLQARQCNSGRAAHLPPTCAPEFGSFTVRSNPPSEANPDRAKPFSRAGAAAEWSSLRVPTCPRAGNGCATISWTAEVTQFNAPSGGGGCISSMSHFAPRNRTLPRERAPLISGLRSAALEGGTLRSAAP